MSGQHIAVPAWREAHKTFEAHEWMGDALRAQRVTPMGVFEGNGRRVVLDWGDACVTHPFLSLAVLERSMTGQLGADQGAAMARLRDACLEPWERDASTGSLRAAARIGAILGGVTRALSWHRTATLDPDTFSWLETLRADRDPKARPARNTET